MIMKSRFLLFTENSELEGKLDHYWNGHRFASPLAL